MTTAIGVDLGGTKTTAGLVLPSGEVRFAATVPTPATSGPPVVTEAVADLVSGVLVRARSAGVEVPDLLGVGSAGVVDRATGSITSATDALHGWAGTPLAARLSAATGLETHVLNDVHAHALGEARYGAGRGEPTVLVVAVGTGVGGALVVDGRPLGGAHGAAGHLGHVPAAEAAGLPCPCGATGHLEALASGPGLLAAHRRLAGDSSSVRDAREVVGLAWSGDQTAREAVMLAATALGRALGGWVNCFDPSLVVLTGGLVTAGSAWWGGVLQAAEAEYVPAVRPCRIVPAALGPLAALVGAAGWALDRAALRAPVAAR